eukprot:432862-Amphidinium_carterae.1
MRKAHSRIQRQCTWRAASASLVRIASTFAADLRQIAFAAMRGNAQQILCEGTTCNSTSDDVCCALEGTCATMVRHELEDLQQDPLLMRL